MLALGAGCGAPPDGAESQQSPLADGKPPAGGVIVGIESFGDGCPSSETTAPLSPDGQAFTAIFSRFQVSADPNGQGTRERSCLLRVRVQVPTGAAFTMNGVHVRGYTLLEDGVSATRQSVYFMPASRPETRAPSFQGAVEEDFTHIDVGADSPVGWSACGSGGVVDVWMGSKIAIQNSAAPAATGLFAVDTIDGELAWRPCK